jgi:hypothetical protein
MGYVWDPNLTNLVEPPAALTADGYAFESVPFSEHVNFLWNVSTAGNGNSMPVGSVLTTVGPIKPDIPGWLEVAEEGTFGNANSSATVRANADTQNLYEYIWANIPDEYCPVIGGRGPTSTADFVAGKALTIPKLNGRVVACAGTEFVPGYLAGNSFNNSLITVDNLAAHTHTQTAHTHQLVMDPHAHRMISQPRFGGSQTDLQTLKPYTAEVYQGDFFFEGYNFVVDGFTPVTPGQELIRNTTTTGTARSGGGGNTGSTGGNVPLDVQQFTIYLSMWIKL